MATACHTCGEPGWPETLVYCSNCNAPEHQYCFSKLPSYILAGEEKVSEDVLHRLCTQCESKISNVELMCHESTRNLNNKHKYNIHTNERNLIHKKKDQRKASKFSVNCSLSDHKKRCTFFEDPMPSASKKDASDSYSLPNRLEKRERSLKDILLDEKSKKRRRSTTEGHKYATIQSKCYSLADITREVVSSQSSAKEASGMKVIQSRSKRLGICRTAKDEQTRSPRRKLLSKKELDEEAPVIHNGQRCNIDTSRRAILRHNASPKAQTISEEKCQDSIRNMPGQSCFTVDQVYFWAQPIIYYTWRGCLDICGEEYHPVAAHMSSLACEEVWNFAKDLPGLLQFEKLPRSSAWPKSFERPISEESIALYLFPHEHRMEEPFHQLVVNGLGKDFVLLIVLEEVEFLVFSSVLLPEKNHRFHGNYYLCGAFRAKRTSSTEASCLNPKQALAELTVGEQRMRIPEHGDRAREQNIDYSAVVSKNLQCSSPTPGPRLILEQARVETTVENGSLNDSGYASPKKAQVARDSSLAFSENPTVTYNLTAGPCQITMHAQDGVSHEKSRSKESAISSAVAETGDNGVADKQILPDHWSATMLEVCAPEELDKSKGSVKK